jgi:hypothetical protein
MQEEIKLLKVCTFVVPLCEHLHLVKLDSSSSLLHAIVTICLGLSLQIVSEERTEVSHEPWPNGELMCHISCLLYMTLNQNLLHSGTRASAIVNSYWKS